MVCLLEFVYLLFPCFLCLFWQNLWVSHPTGLTCGVLKLSATEVTMALPGTDPIFSFSVILRFLSLSDWAWMDDGVDDNDNE